MALFGLGKKKASAGGAQGVPTDKVIQMRQQGYSNDQIIQSLQQEGFSSSQIFDAMSQADIKGAAGGEASAPAPPGPMPAPAPAEMPLPEMPPMPAPEAAPVGIDKEMIEEIAESIIDEKWDELMKNVDKIVAWKEDTESKIDKMEQKMKDLKERFDTLHKGVLSKITDYDKNIRGVGTDVKAMEEVFKKVLPTFTANVGELSRLTRKMKPARSRKK